MAVLVIPALMESISEAWGGSAYASDIHEPSIWCVTLNLLEICINNGFGRKERTGGDMGVVTVEKSKSRNLGLGTGDAFWVKERKKETRSIKSIAS